MANNLDFNMRLLENKNIVITGGSLGIGLKIAEFCLREGATIILCARNLDDLNNAKVQLLSIYPKATIYKESLDVSDSSKVETFAENISKKMEIHGLVNSAGIYGPIGKTTSVSMEAFTRAIQVNFLGTVYMCHAIGKRMNPNLSTKIVNLSGGGAATPFANYSAYATSKIAIVRFTENLSLELADDNTAVNCVAPGFVITRLHQDTINAGSDFAGENFLDNTKKQIESGGVPPDKAAELVVFLLSDASKGITGKFISAPWDPWTTNEFQELVKEDKDFATLRRIDNKTFFKK